MALFVASRFLTVWPSSSASLGSSCAHTPREAEGFGWRQTLPRQAPKRVN
jgi:hypothetical protein